VTDRLDRMFAELDRQLEEVREQAAALTTRVGLVLSATTITAALVAIDLQTIKGGEITSFVLVGIAILAGFAALVPALVVGPDPSTLELWAVQSGATNAVSALYASKLGTLRVNRKRFQVMFVTFYIQLGAALGSVAAGVAAAAWR
jgi:hypothetical protein